MPKPTFKVRQNPCDRLWYVVGSCGGGWMMPVSEGRTTRSEALEDMRRVPQAEASARAELRGGSLAVYA
jgi:hypothetical protein